MSEVHKA